MVEEKVTPKYPHLSLSLYTTGPEGNAFVILAKAKAVIRRGVGKEEAEAYFKEATSAKYNDLVKCTARWISFHDLSHQFDDDGNRNPDFDHDDEPAPFEPDQYDEGDEDDDDPYGADHEFDDYEDWDYDEPY